MEWWLSIGVVNERKDGIGSILFLTVSPKADKDCLVSAASSRSTLARQWELLKLLPPRTPGASASELQGRLQESGFSASKRTVERDLTELSRLFPIQCNSKGVPYGWYWESERSIDLPGITLSDALTVCLVEGSIKALMPSSMLKSLEPRFNQARSKLEALGESNPAARWMEKVATVQPDLSLLPPKVDPVVLGIVQEALLSDSQLSCHYYSVHRDKEHRFTLNPLGLIQRSSTTYLIATVEPFDDLRQFALHRFLKASKLEYSCNRPSGFSLSSYIASGAMQFGGCERISLKAWISDDLVRLVRETPIAEDMRLTADEQGDGEILEATVLNSWELHWWLLSHSGKVRILAPNALRADVLEKMKAGVDLNQLNSD